MIAEYTVRISGQFLATTDFHQLPGVEISQYGEAEIVGFVEMPLHGSPAAHDDFKFSLDGKDARTLRGLKFRYKRDFFNRQRRGPFDPPRKAHLGFSDQLDPPLNDVLAIANRFLSKYNAAGGTLLKATTDAWTLRYWTDEGEPLQATESEIGCAASVSGPLIEVKLLSPLAWREAVKLSHDFVQPPWDRILAEAVNQLPNAGMVVILAWTALEALIDHAIAVLRPRSKISPELLEWIFGRDHFHQQPSMREKFTVLQKALTGKSLEDAPTLLANFDELRHTRNSAVHTGQVKRGKAPKKGKPDRRPLLTASDAQELHRHAVEIAGFVNALLPANEQWARAPTVSQSLGMEVRPDSIRSGWCEDLEIPVVSPR